MLREVHKKTMRVWKTNEGRVLLTASGEKFWVDTFECSEAELQALQCAIQEVFSGWGNTPYAEFMNDIPQTEGKSDALPIEKNG